MDKGTPQDWSKLIRGNKPDPNADQDIDLPSGNKPEFLPQPPLFNESGGFLFDLKQFLRAALVTLDRKRLIFSALVGASPGRRRLFANNQTNRFPWLAVGPYGLDGIAADIGNRTNWNPWE